MIQCEGCEYFERGEAGEMIFNCDPFSTVKGTECLLKWQLMKLNEMADFYERTLEYYERFAPMQEKMFHAMEKEIDSMNEAERWKYTEDEEHDDDLDLGYDDDMDDEDRPLY